MCIPVPTAYIDTRMYAQEDLDLYKRANWQRAVSLVLGMLMGGNEGGKAKTVSPFIVFRATP